jgi:nicotinamidase-related amidase
MRIHAKLSTLLIIDIQTRLFPAIAEHERLAAHTLWLQQVAQRLDVPVLLTEQYSKGLGPTIPALRNQPGNTAIIEKLHFSAVSEGALLAQTDAQRTQFVVCGCEAHVCVMQTVLDLLVQGRQVFVVAEAVGSRQASDKALALARMQQAGAVIVSREMVAFEWLERAGSELFRSVSREFIR